ncbi:MAG: hypothetical protein ABH871_05900 [Pseudomonadota bacterium]
MSIIERLLLLIILTLLPLTVFAEPVNRNILAVIDPTEINFISSYAEMPMNHLGFKLDYVDVTKHLPSDDEMQKYFGIISWFNDNKIKGATNYVKWLTGQLEKGKKVVIINDFGFDFDDKESPTPDDVLNKFYQAFHISFDSLKSATSPLLIEVAYNDPEITEFERSLKGEVNLYKKIDVLDKDAKVFLKLKRKKEGDTSDAVFVNSKGGFALNSGVYINPINYQSRWKINPFKFFSLAFNADFPKPDTTSINGMRYFFSHMDGDGIRNVSHIDGVTLCGEMAFREIFTKYNIPVSVSVVVGDLSLAGDEQRRELFKTIKKTFMLPNIEVASHGWAHPLIWQSQKRKMAYKLRGYAYSPENEIGRSIAYINENLAPKGKETDVFFWTGDCRPDYEAVKYAHDHNIKNLNGGDTRFDKEFPSYTFVAPLFRHVDGLLQYFTPEANENVYTNLWTGPFHGYKFVIETLKNTESPIRLRPIDIYYHFYVMEYESSIDSVKSAYDWVLSQEVAPVFASDYLNILDGFLSTKIDKVSPTHWIISDNGDLRTIRIDDYNGYVDLIKSKGVIGFMPYQGSLYVHLDNGERSEIVLTMAPPTQPYLVKANGRIMGWTTDKDEVSFKLYTMGRVQFAIGGLKQNQKYEIDAKDKTFEKQSNVRGELSFSEEMLKNKFEWVKVVVKRGAS